MKFIPGLISKTLPVLKRTQWYHQRFDGSPHFIFLISMAELTPEARKFGCHATSHFGLFEGDVSEWYIDQQDIDRIAGRVLEAGMRQAHFSKKLMKQWAADEADFFHFCTVTRWERIGELSDRALKQLYDEFIRRTLNVVSSSSIIDGFALGTDYLMQTELGVLLKKKDLTQKSGRYFAVLTAPIHHSFINEVEVSVLRIALAVERIPVLRRAFMNESVIQIRNKLTAYPAILRALKKQERDYFWSKNNYVHNLYLDVNSWIAELKGIFASRINIREQIISIVETPKRNLRDKQKLAAKLSLSKKLRTLLEISEDFTHWQDSRKKHTYWSMHYGSLLLAEIGRRFGYTLHEMKYLIAPEVDTLFTYPFVTQKEARDRKKKCFWVQVGKSRYEIVTGKRASRLYAQALAKKSKKDVNDFRGLSANHGVVRGPVKIIKSATEIHKIRQGDILVAVMTRPDYISGMKKAAAIVTNEGGVTCHAAIVAREINIPCVIGTKIATDVLHDGDIVEVNGNHGVVTIIKRVFMRKTYYLWDLANTLFPERWDQKKSGVSNYPAFVESLGYSLETVTPKQFEDAYEEPYKKGFFDISLVPGFVEVLGWTKNNSYFTTGVHEVNVWRSVQLKRKTPVDIFTYLSKGFSTFDYGDTNVKTIPMLIDILHKLNAQGFTEVVYTDDKAENCQFFLDAVAQARKEGINVVGRTYHLTDAQEKGAPGIIPIKNLFELRDREKHHIQTE
ncbi:MAG: PEP-utilizing enzyme [Patescibacteria group bacterium]|jgi:phosphohistidine swiveling domain-containing protein